MDLPEGLLCQLTVNGAGEDDSSVRTCFVINLLGSSKELCVGFVFIASCERLEL